MWVGEFGLVSLPDGTLHSPHHKTIRRGLTELPAPPSLYQRPRNVHMIAPLPQTSFLLSFASRKCVGKRVWPEQKKKNNKLNEREEQSFKRRMWKRWVLGWPGGELSLSMQHQSWHPKGHTYLCSHPQDSKKQLVLPHFPRRAMHFCCRAVSQHPPRPLLLLIQHREMLTGCTAPASPSSILKMERTHFWL